MKKILINAALPGELRVAEIHGSYLANLDIENRTRVRIQNNIYKGVVSKVDAGIEVYFVDFGDSRGGFLPFRNVPEDIGGTGEGGRLAKGDELLVQVVIDKTDQEGKGAVLTGTIKFVGKYVVLTPSATGKRQIPNTVTTEEAPKVNELIEQLDVPDDVGISLRINALSVGAQQVKDELQALLGDWQDVQDKAGDSKAPTLLMREHSAGIRILRDRLDDSVGEVHIDTQEAYDEVTEWVQSALPDYTDKVKLHSESMPIFQYHGIEDQVNLVHQRRVKLPSGGDVMIDHTAAMTTIDINSSKGSAANMEETALQTNLEAVKEITRQIRLRDIGGQIAIDLIDMKEPQNRADVERIFRDYMRNDAGNPKIAEITEFCLLLMTRRRMRPSVSDNFDEVCPSCAGAGRIRNQYSVATSLLREAQRLAVNENANYISMLVSPTVASVLFNDFRDSIIMVEENCEVSIVITPNHNLKQQDFHIMAGPDESQIHEVEPGVTFGKAQHHKRAPGRSSEKDAKDDRTKRTNSNMLEKLFFSLRHGNPKPIRSSNKRSGQGQGRQQREDGGSGRRRSRGGRNRRRGGGGGGRGGPGGGPGGPGGGQGGGQGGQGQQGNQQRSQRSDQQSPRQSSQQNAQQSDGNQARPEQKPQQSSPQRVETKTPSTSESAN